MNRDSMVRAVRTRSQPWDMIVIGGGATGAGIALDAASRGYSVALFEAYDFGKGTSTRSTKLVHGGVRYLRNGQISLVTEALQERGILLRNAPDVAHELGFLLPIYRTWEWPFYGAGLKAYDLLARRYALGPTRFLSRNETIRRMPSIRTNGLQGSILYYDGQFDDARLLVQILRTAADCGATVLNYAPVTRVDGRAVTARDAETSEELRAEARTVINATGPFSDDIRRLADPNATRTLATSQGSHVVVDRSFLPSGEALMVPKTSDGRVLFAIPWHGHTLIGTTDVPVPGATPEPRPLSSEIDFILDTAKGYLSKPPSRADVLSTFAGIRPLVLRGAGKNTAALSRDHSIFVESNGMLTIVGGKWTTYRSMAEECVDKAAAAAGLPRRPCRTRDLRVAPPQRSPAGLQLHPALPYSEADVTNAVRSEMARTVEDVLARRTRALFLNVRAARSMAPRVAELMKPEMQWSDDEVRRQIADFDATAEGYVPR